jgi:hemerythrin-like domain-containing protein
MMDLHEGLAELFHRHQVALLDRDVAAARHWLTRFRDALLAHMQDEEERILPVYAERGGRDTNSPPEQFEVEHRKLRELTTRLESRVAELADPPDDRALLDLFDLESSFRSLMTHHDLRERRVLYPSLSSWTSAAEQAEILGSVQLREIDIGTGPRPLLPVVSPDPG